MQAINIKKVEVGEKFVTVTYSKEESRQGITLSVTTKRKFPFNIHDELRDALNELKPHFALCTESYQVVKGQNLEHIKGSSEMEGFEVTGFEIKRSGDNFGVVIMGHRKLQDGRTVKFSTPFVNFDVEISEYVHIEDLIASVDIAKDEAIEYVLGKFKPQGTQLSLGDAPEVKPVTKLSSNAKSKAA